MSILALVLTLSLSGAQTGDQPDAPPAVIAASDTAQETAAREWLALADAGDWVASHTAAAREFQAALPVDSFASTMRSVKEPLGAVVSREPITFERTNSNGRDYAIVRFRTEFANGMALTEQVTLAREDGALKVAGYFFTE